MRFKLAAAERGWLRHPFAVPREVRSWLADEGSLTARLRSRCSGFSVRLAHAGRGRPNQDELRAMRLRAGSTAYVREVVLYCGGTEVVFAHSVVPAASLRGAWAAVTRLGTRPLGEALFSNPCVVRGVLEYRRINLRHPLSRQARRAGVAWHDRAMWARRSVFVLRGHPLMVTEVFLPAIAEMPR